MILDDGFFLRENRIRCVERSHGVGAGAKIHFIDTPLSLLRERLEERNAMLPPYNFWLGPDLLQVFASLFETPARDEGADLVVVKDLGNARANSRDA